MFYLYNADHVKLEEFYNLKDAIDEVMDNHSSTFYKLTVERASGTKCYVRVEMGSTSYMYEIDEVSYDDMVRAKGIHSYDTALPQEWVNAFITKTGYNPVGEFCWSYDGKTISGNPVALTDRAQANLDRFKERG